MSTEQASHSAPGLLFHVSSEEGTLLVQCCGRLTFENAPALKREVKNLMAGNRRLVLDLKELTRMDSSGLGALVSVYLSAKSAGCELNLVNMSTPIRDLLGLTNLLSVFESCGRDGIRMS